MGPPRSSRLSSPLSLRRPPGRPALHRSAAAAVPQQALSREQFAALARIPRPAAPLPHPGGMIRHRPAPGRRRRRALGRSSWRQASGLILGRRRADRAADLSLPPGDAPPRNPARYFAKQDVQTGSGWVHQPARPRRSPAGDARPSARASPAGENGPGDPRCSPRGSLCGVCSYSRASMATASRSRST